MKYPIVVPGVGPVPCSGMIVGEAPGRQEIEARQPFVGASGKLLEDALEQAGISRHDVYITNVFKGDVGEGNRNPYEEEIHDHFGALLDEFESVEPKATLLLGKVAIKQFFPTINTLSQVVGKSYPSLRGTLHPCYHPAYILYRRNFQNLTSFYGVVDDFVRSFKDS